MHAASAVSPSTNQIGVAFAARATMESDPAFLFDALVLSDCEVGVASLMQDGRTLGFIKDQYRQCKTIMAGASAALLEKAEVSAKLPTGEPDAGVIIASDATKFVGAFIEGVAAHRYPQRETDPPLI
jgi:catalase